MSRILYRFERCPLLGRKEIVEIRDIDILIVIDMETYKIPIKDIKSIAATGKKSILIGYSVGYDQLCYYQIKDVHTRDVVIEKLIELIKKNAIQFRPISIGFS